MCVLCAPIQAAGFSKPFSGSFKIKFSKSKGDLTVEFQMSNEPGGTYFRVTGESEHILYSYYDTFTGTGTMQGIVALNDSVLKK